MKVKSESEVVQSCPTLSDPMDYSPPGSSVHGIFQAKVPEWVAIAFSKAPKTHFHLTSSNNKLSVKIREGSWFRKTGMSVALASQVPLEGKTRKAYMKCHMVGGTEE